MNVLIEKPRSTASYGARWRFLVIVMMSAMAVLFGRAIDLQVLDRQFLKHEGDKRHKATIRVPAYRGRITDRHGEPLAISTPVKSIWINPAEFAPSEQTLKRLSSALGVPANDIQKRLEARAQRKFIYIKRRLSPELADQVTALGIPGVYSEREYRRFYPAGEVTAHMLGYTNIDDKGQEGMELSFNDWLRGVPGSKRIIRDGKRRIIEDLNNSRPPVPGRDLKLSIDQRLQYLAYLELKKAVLQHRAKSGSLALLDAHTGEVLAMVNQPSYNPNKRTGIKGGLSRNRVVTDVFEPGSTMKPFAVACALELGLLRADSIVDTTPGQMRLGRNLVRDIHNYGVLDVARVLQKSSNVGVSKIALSLPRAKFWAFYNNLGFGQPLGTGFPGEVSGKLPAYQSWRSPFQQAILSFGYGLSTSTLQLARAYLALANDGSMPMVSLLKNDGAPEAYRIMSAKTAHSVRSMLEQVVSREGTAIQASVPGFRIAGKTGTVKKASAGGYERGAYLSLFAGMAPASRPRLVMVVMIDEPSAGEYYGGAVAAPVFSSVMGEALRIMNAVPDQEETGPLLTAEESGVL
jgi:cell division protein FtsI (penicillin-binding protein 3)